MINLFTIILFIGITAFMFYKLYIEYQKSETIDEKVVFWLILIIVGIPLLIFYLDRYDVISKIGWFKNSSSDRWFSFIETYLSALISSIIGAVALVLMTIHQLNLEREKNTEDKRIQNAPIFKYNIQNIGVQTDLQYNILNDNKGNSYSLFMYIENVGLNHARNIEFCINDFSSKNNQMFKLDNAQSILKKDDSKWFQFIFNYKYDDNKQKNNNKQIQILVSYEDLLNNKYNQEINLYVEVTNQAGAQYNGYKLYIVSTEVKNEIYIKEEVK